MFEINNKTIALNVLYGQQNSEEIRYAYISKRNSTRENQVKELLKELLKKKKNYVW